MTVSVVVGSAAAALVTALTVVAASLPDAQALLSPLTEGGNEYAVATASVLASVPIISLLALLALTAKGYDD